MSRRRPDPAPVPAAPERIRLDRWLHHARVFKSRTLAAEAISAGGVRVNGAPCRAPDRLVGAGDEVTVGSRDRALRVLAPGTRRGPSAEAATLYQDLTRVEPGAPPD